MGKAHAITDLNPQAPTAQNARSIVRVRLNEMYSYAQYSTSIDHIHELHDLRIAAKRVRYTLEIFEQFLPEICQKFAKELAKLQEELGALHDSEVLIALLELCLQQGKDRVKTQAYETPLSNMRKTLLSPAMARSVLKPSKGSTLSPGERDGLLNFLHTQEQNRQTCYTAFRTHWNKLEQEHFYDQILRSLSQNTESQE